MRKWKLNDIESALSTSGGDSEVFCTGVSIDSRTLKAGDMFVCIRGENSDGHNYISDALALGASAIISEKSDESIKAACKGHGAALFQVPDGTEALGRLASYYRSLLKGKIIGVTGSNGKTSTKEMLLGIGERLLGKGEVYATPGNLNNQWGLPLSILRADPDNRIIILEMGMNHEKEIEALSRIARPDISIITSVASAHIGNLGSLDAILRAKLEILEGMRSGPGSALVYGESYYGCREARKVSEQRGIRFRTFGFDSKNGVVSDENGIRFDFHGHRVENPHYFHLAMAMNMIGAMTVYEELGFPVEEIAAAASETAPLTGRRFQMFRKKMGDGRISTLVDDSYNANEHSFVEAIRALRKLLPTGRLCLFAGEMAELGSDSSSAHSHVGESAAEENFEMVAVSGGKNAEKILAVYRDNKSDGEIFLAGNVEDLKKLAEKPGFLDNFDGILIKGSRSSRMDLLSDSLKLTGYV